MDKSKEPAQHEEAQKEFRPYSLEPDLARKSNKIRARAQHLLSTLPAATLWDFTPRFMRATRLKFRAKRESASGQVFANADGYYESPSLNTMLEEEGFHVRQSYEQWGSILDEIQATIRPYAATVDALEQSEATVRRRADEAYKAAYEEERPAYSEMSVEEVLDARTFHANRARAATLREHPADPDSADKIEYARYQIQACGLLDLWQTIVGDADNGGYALERSLQIQNSLRARQELWISWSGTHDSMARFPRLDVGADSAIHRRFTKRYERTPFLGARCTPAAATAATERF